MKKTLLLSALLALGASLPSSQAGDPVSAKSPIVAAAESCLHGRPDSHAPIGVMGDHAHGAGEIMLGYRYMYSHDAGIIAGDRSISNASVYEYKTPAGEHYSAVPLEMDMHMHMWEIMYAPTDWLTLMVMPSYVEMDMTMEHQAGAHGHGAAGHAAAGHAEHGAEPAHGEIERMSHGTSGWGDTMISALVPVLRADHHEAVLHLGISAPTGSVDIKQHGQYTHYHMQTGSGTWDLKPGITYHGCAGNISWGAQVMGTVRLEDENESGYRLGNVWEATGWAAYKVCDWASVSSRLLWTSSEDIDGHYNGPHGHGSPVDIQQNYGGDRLDLGLGVNFLVPDGALKGHRLAIEALWAVDQESNGIFLERDISIVAGWQFAF
jgi:hypothetical protein